MFSIPNRSSSIWLFTGLMCAAPFFAGCAAKRVLKTTGSDDATASGGANADDGLLDPGVDVAEGDIRAGSYAEVTDLKPAHFAYDRYTLTSKSRITLRENAAYLKAHPDLEVLVEGHCDDRGTLGYNLSLGQRRAKAVREYYIRLGVRGRQIATISFGEEKGVCFDPTDGCWLQNRRAETKIRAQVSSNGFNKRPATP